MNELHDFEFLSEGDDALVDGMMEDILIKFEVYFMAHDVMDDFSR